MWKNTLLMVIVAMAVLTNANPIPAGDNCELHQKHRATNDKTEAPLPVVTLEATKPSTDYEDLSTTMESIAEIGTLKPGLRKHLFDSNEDSPITTIITLMPNRPIVELISKELFPAILSDQKETSTKSKIALEPTTANIASITTIKPEETTVPIAVIVAKDSNEFTTTIPTQMKEIDDTISSETSATVTKESDLDETTTDMPTTLGCNSMNEVSSPANSCVTVKPLIFEEKKDENKNTLESINLALPVDSSKNAEEHSVEPATLVFDDEMTTIIPVINTIFNETSTSPMNGEKKDKNKNNDNILESITLTSPIGSSNNIVEHPVKSVTMFFEDVMMTTIIPVTDETFDETSTSPMNGEKKDENKNCGNTIESITLAFPVDSPSNVAVHLVEPVTMVFEEEMSTMMHVTDKTFDETPTSTLNSEDKLIKSELNDTDIMATIQPNKTMVIAEKNPTTTVTNRLSSVDDTNRERKILFVFNDATTTIVEEVEVVTTELPTTVDFSTEDTTLDSNTTPIMEYVHSRVASLTNKNSFSDEETTETNDDYTKTAVIASNQTSEAATVTDEEGKLKSILVDSEDALTIETVPTAMLPENSINVNKLLAFLEKAVDNSESQDVSPKNVSKNRSETKIEPTTFVPLKETVETSTFKLITRTKQQVTEVTEANKLPLVDVTTKKPTSIRNSRISMQTNDESKSMPFDEENISNPDGTFSYGYKTEFGTNVQRHSYYKKAIVPQYDNMGSKYGDEETNVLVQEGSYSYLLPDGTELVVNFIADENGYRTKENKIAAKLYN